MFSSELPTDVELFDAVRGNDKNRFNIKTQSPHLDHLRFTDTLFNVLHLCCYYQRKEMVEILLETDYCTNLINGKDRNGETPLHIATFQCNQEIIVALMNKGASFAAKNIYSKDPIDIIACYSERKELLKNLLGLKLKLKPSEIDILSQH